MKNSAFDESRRVSNYLLEHVIPEINGTREGIGMAFLTLGAAMLGKDAPELLADCLCGVVRELAISAKAGRR